MQEGSKGGGAERRQTVGSMQVVKYVHMARETRPGERCRKREVCMSCERYRQAGKKRGTGREKDGFRND